MEELENLCNEVLQKTQEKGGRISAVYYQQLVKNNERYFRQVKMKLFALGLIENRDDNKIRLTEKGLKVKNIKEAERMDKPQNRLKKWALAFLGIVVASVIGYHTEKVIEFIYRLLKIN